MGVFGHFFDAVKNHYADFEGTATREQIWMYVLGSFIFAILFGIIDGITGTLVFGALFNLALLLPGISIMARRLHDRNMSGFWQLVPFLGLVVMFLPSYKKKNVLKKYGGTMK